MVRADKFVKINVSLKEGRHVSDTIVDWMSDVKTEEIISKISPFLLSIRTFLVKGITGEKSGKKRKVYRSPELVLT